MHCRKNKRLSDPSLHELVNHGTECVAEPRLRLLQVCVLKDLV